ncbi:MAG TPA: DUF4093 domain-containing protein [Clostridiales bacterium]|nr:DUF4093 domain-containing protein [Clostridiales bacterium]HRT81931.1 DUF4093 domain-containing protein [Oscillospiraceae bacterium]
MLRINQAVIVEGKHDKIKLESVIDALIITTDGFGIFNNKEKQKFIRRLALEKGILIITDSDSAGFKIRGFLKGIVEEGQIFHAYIPEIKGKERRKESPSKEGTLGVEGMPKEIIEEALNKAGVAFESQVVASRRITQLDLYNDGFSGRKDSKKKKELLLKSLDLPAKLSTKAFLQLINMFLTYDEYKNAVENSCSED